MIKAKSGETIILGLSDKNIELLKQDKPIIINGDEVGIPGQRIVIMWGQTEKIIAQRLIETFNYRRN